jgi:hypothetical protein
VIDLYKKRKSLDDEDVKFIYKGGTTMKIIYSQYRDTMNECDCPNFKNNILDCFNRSDSDYHIKISSKMLHIGRYNEIYYDMSKITILALKHIKKLLIVHNKFFMDIQKNILSTDLQGLLGEMNTTLSVIKPLSVDFRDVKQIIGIQSGNAYYVDNSHFNNPSFQDLFNNTTTTRKDFFVTKDNIDDTLSQNVYLGRLTHKDDLNIDDNLFITANETVIFSTNLKGAEYTERPQFANDAKIDDYTEAFLLSRIKYNFIIYYIKDDNTYGRFKSYSEIVDVSMNKENASQNLLVSKIMYTSYKYTFQKGTPNQLSVKYTGYSIKGFIHDLTAIFFYKVHYPWEDKKYKKRLYRSLFFIYIELIQGQLFSKTVLNGILDMLTENKQIRDFDNYISSKIASNLIYSLFTQTATYLFFKNINRIKNDVSITPNNSKLTKNLNEFIIKIIDTLTEFKNNQAVQSYTTCGVAPCDVSQLGGNIDMQKYIKYLNKNKGILKMIESNQI